MIYLSQWQNVQYVFLPMMVMATGEEELRRDDRLDHIRHKQQTSSAISSSGFPMLGYRLCYCSLLVARCGI